MAEHRGEFVVIIEERTVLDPLHLEAALCCSVDPRRQLAQLAVSTANVATVAIDFMRPPSL